MSALPRPGELLLHDFRLHPRKAEPGKPLRLFQFNIERGYKLDDVIAELLKEDAQEPLDVIALQEVDIGCERSAGEDTGCPIAEALHMNYAFLCEFEELRSAERAARDQGGGVHGNAILTRHDLLHCRALEHSTHPMDWNNTSHELVQREPRRGRRLTLAALVHAEQRPPLLVYSVHLEVFCGTLARIAQFSDIMRDSKQQIDQGIVHQAILGDLNTMGHGIARLSRRHCTDALRFLSLGSYEAEVWHACVLSQMDPDYAVDEPPPGASAPAKGPPHGGQARRQESATSASAEEGTAGDSARHTSASAEEGTAGDSARHNGGGQKGLAPGAEGGGAGSGGGAAARPGAGAPGAHLNQRLRRWGVSEAVCRDVLNPGFYDPFPVNLVTLDNPAYRVLGMPLMEGKLDWVLLRRLRARATAVGNHDYSLSDHKWLSASVDSC